MLTKKQKKITFTGILVIFIAFILYFFLIGKTKLAITSGNLDYLKSKCGTNNFYNIYDCNGYFCIDSLSGRCVDVDSDCKAKNEVIYNCLNLVPKSTTKTVWYATITNECSDTTTDSLFYEINPNGKWYDSQTDCFKAVNPSAITCYYCSGGQLTYTIGDYGDCSEIGKSDASTEKIACSTNCIPKWNKFLIGGCVKGMQKVDWYDDNNCNDESTKPTSTKDSCESLVNSKEDGIINSKEDGIIVCTQNQADCSWGLFKEFINLPTQYIGKCDENYDGKKQLASVCNIVTQTITKKDVTITKKDASTTKPLKCTKFQTLKDGSCKFSFEKFVKDTTVLVSFITGFVLLIIIIFLVFLPKKGRRKK